MSHCYTLCWLVASTACANKRVRRSGYISLRTCHGVPHCELALRAGQETTFIHAPSHNAELLGRQFATLAKAGAHGVMLDVWCADSLFILLCSMYCGALLLCVGA